MSEFWSAAQLAVFARVVELNGFSAAARAYGVPKVAVSRAIADLEKSMGVQLMKRTTRRIFLTAAGDAVLPHARAIGVEVEKVRQLAQTFSTSREGPLRVIADADLWPRVARAAGAALPRQLPRHRARRGAGRQRGCRMGRGDSRRRQRGPEARCAVARRAARGVVRHARHTCRNIPRRTVPKDCAITRC